MSHRISDSVQETCVAGAGADEHTSYVTKPKNRGKKKGAPLVEGSEAAQATK